MSEFARIAAVFSLLGLSCCTVRSGSAFEVVSSAESYQSSGPSAAQGQHYERRNRGCADQEFGADAAGEIDGARTFEGNVINGCLGDGDEQDFFAIDVPEFDAGVVYSFKASTTKHFAFVEIYDQDRNYLRQVHLKENSGGHIWATAKGDTRFYVLVKGFDGGDAYPYRVVIKSNGIDDRAEPNEERDDAKRIKLGEEVEAFMAPRINDAKEDTDFYRVKVKRRGTMHVVVDYVPSDLAVRASIFDADGNRIETGQSANKGALVRIKDKVKPGTYYVKFSSYNAERFDHGALNKHVRKPYRFTVSVD